MPREFQYTPLDEALRILFRNLVPRERAEEVAVRRAYGRLLSADVVAKDDMPLRDVSHFDGFAVNSFDTTRASKAGPVTLALRRGTEHVGLFPKEKLMLGEAMKISTGGYVPKGADAVVAVEDATQSAGTVIVDAPVRKGEHIYAAGQDVKKGERVLLSGRTLKGQDLAMLASLHITKVSVRRKPMVAIIPTGTELTANIAETRSGKVVESHSLLLGRLIEEAGGQVVKSGIIPDEKRALRRALKGALRRSDIVLTLAGSSVGEPDLVESTITSFGRSTTVLVHGIRVHRGRVMGVAVVEGKPVVVLPGPVQGALNAFILFGYPLIRHHLGLGLEEPPAVQAVVAEDWEASGKFKDFDQIVYLKLEKEGAGERARMVALPASGETEKMSFLLSKNGYALVSGKKGKLSKGETIWVRLLPGFSMLD
ncbi:MAG: molybdopterin molybdotransferase MoeA [Thaumarchaeota archaeon]|nr:molybdopterin molybdotransferase MoeA [Nitrososphaerota archaeon]